VYYIENIDICIPVEEAAVAKGLIDIFFDQKFINLKTAATAETGQDPLSCITELWLTL